MKKAICKLLMVCMLFGILSGGVVQAEGVKKALDGVAITGESSSEVTTYSTIKGVYLWYGTAAIMHRGTGIVGVGGTTFARQNVPYVSVTVVLNYYENGAWREFYRWSAGTANANYATYSTMAYVPRGRYYYVRTYHAGGGEFLTGASDGIWMG